MMIVAIPGREKERMPKWKSEVIETLMRYSGKVQMLVIDAPELRQSLQSKIEQRVVGKTEMVEPNLTAKYVTESDCSGCTIVNLTTVKEEEIILRCKAKNVLEFQYGGRNLASLCSIGEYEVAYNAPSVDVSLICLEDTGNMKVLAYDRLKRDFSAVRMLQNAQNDCKILLSHYLSGVQYPVEIQPCTKLTGRVKYLMKFYSSVAGRLTERIKAKLVGSHGEHWTVGLGNAPFLKSDYSSLVTISIPNNEFWADPFLFSHDGHLYLFVERYPFDTCKGVISCGEIVENRVENMHDVLVRPYHLSYPNIVEEDGEIYMIPECSENRCIEVWKAVDFPNRWELYSSAFHGKSMADTVYYRDENGKRWLFSSEADFSQQEHCYKLSLYKIGSLKMTKVEEHPMSPIVLDCSCARNGGRIFEQDGHIYRTAQDNRYGEYGHGVAILEIVKLTDTKYEERVVKRLDHPVCNGMLGTHHMTESAGRYVIDICTRR